MKNLFTFLFPTLTLFSQLNFNNISLINNVSTSGAIKTHVNIEPIDDLVNINFFGLSDGCLNYLYWNNTTDYILNNYELEYSYDGKYFIHLDSINPKNENIYSYPVGTMSNDNYYRLKYHYSNGNIDYTKVIHLKCNCSDYKP